jgi:spore maturation protein CgeB
VLTEWRPDIDAYGLQEDISIAVYRSLDELVEKVRYYLEHPEERERISRNGRQIVLESLTYDHCAAKMIEQIGSVVGRQERR